MAEWSTRAIEVAVQRHLYAFSHRLHKWELQVQILPAPPIKVTMYSVTRNNHKKYGNIIDLKRDDKGDCETPFVAYNQAKKQRRLWMESDGIKVRILVDGKVMTVAQAEHWSYEEYKSLPKCEGCAKILKDEVFTHRLSGKSLFCTQKCADKDFEYQMEKLSDEDECDCF